MDIESNKIAGDFVDPNASEEAKLAILSARALMYSQDGRVVMQAIEGSGSLVDGSVPIIAMVINSVEEKLGQLSDQDLMSVIAHLAGTVVEIARDLGDPEALEEDGKYATEEIIDGVVDLISGEMEEQDDEMMAMQGEQMPPEMPPQDEMALLGGM